MGETDAPARAFRDIRLIDPRYFKPNHFLVF